MIDNQKYEIWFTTSIEPITVTGTIELVTILIKYSKLSYILKKITALD